MRREERTAEKKRLLDEKKTLKARGELANEKVRQAWDEATRLFLIWRDKAHNWLDVQAIQGELSQTEYNNRIGRLYDMKPPDLPVLKEFAKGGIVLSPTIGLIGEAGPEAVIPLDKAGGMQDLVGNGMPNITVNIENAVGDVKEEVIEAIQVGLDRYNAIN